MADEIAVMYMGVIVERGPAAAVCANALHPYTRMLLASVLLRTIEAPVQWQVKERTTRS